ncbi:hypothetical protein Tsubulata_005020 [Turnera subulata]|uniref:Uncharacterized protein n=1 Tax=Turnera subulata TaxID=218843 RepID=A0A9Q0FB10_9ROSI|nr:hypothetical protein Tsubulata_005020 [Turnera subulata]
MDFERSSAADRKFLVLQADKWLMNSRLISRNSSVGCSSRIFYYRKGAEGVPFQWEMQPGKPKDPPREETIPPLSPPPAVLSLGLPKPCFDVEEPKVSIRSKLKLWKYIKKLQRINYKKALRGASRRSDNVTVKASTTDDTFVDHDQFCCSDGEFMASPRNSSYSSSSSLSFSVHSRQSSLRSSRLESPARDSSSSQAPYGCSPLHLSAVLGRRRMARRT